MHVNRRFHYLLLALISAFLPPAAGLSAPEAGAADAPGSFTLWQLPEQTPSQMMSYVLRTQNGKVIVIDGGTAGDGAYLRGFLGALGNAVEAWFITHPHHDHAQALAEILPDPRGLRIGAVYASLPELEWALKYEPEEYHASIRQFYQALAGWEGVSVDLEPGTALEIDGMRIEALGARNPEITGNALNNSSVVLRFSDRTKSILFLGDLGSEGGKKLLEGKYRDRLAADYAQMAHHGQNGVNEDVYRAVNPRYCLWPTPRWLWENDAGQGPGAGPWTTLTTRAWMEKLNIVRHYISYQGLHRID